MCSLESFRIDLKGLEAAEMVREYSLGDDYFVAIDAPEVRSGSLHVSATIRKLSGFFELLLHAVGTVRIPCNLCLDDMEQPIEGSSTYIVKLGQGSDETDDVITVNENEGILRLGWLIYELIALAVPIKHVHAPGKCNDAMTRKLEELSATRSGDETAEDDIDPRWAELGKLKIKD